MRRVPRPGQPYRYRDPATYGPGYRKERDRVLATTPEVCALCGGGPRPSHLDPWETDHRVSAVLGGGYVDNLQRTHRSCNRDKGLRTGMARRRRQ